MSNFCLFLGGHDLEMLAIAELARAEGYPVHDKNLNWGARASAYRKEIDHALAAGQTPVPVELIDDIGLAPPRVVVVDLHGASAGAERPTSLRQVFDLLHVPAQRWDRQLALIAANDRGHVRELLAIGAAGEEIENVRAADRAAQGITPGDEETGAAAVRHARTLAGGLLTVVTLPHNRCAVAADRMEHALGGPGYENLLVICPAEVDFFGGGEYVLWLDDAFPGGWFGGALREGIVISCWVLMWRPVDTLVYDWIPWRRERATMTRLLAATVDVRSGKPPGEAGHDAVRGSK